MHYIKTPRLKMGDTVAVVSPSWAGPSIFPKIYENGISALQSLGLKVIELPNTRASHEFNSNNPALRARDINDAFANPNVKAIFASIGGDDSVRILPFLDKDLIIKNPKIIMGFSDTTTLLTYINQLVLVTLHGPAVMAGFSQMLELEEGFRRNIQEMLFDPTEYRELMPYDTYHEGYPVWSMLENLGKVNPGKQDEGWNWLQGSGVVRGELFGGCIEVLEFMKGMDYWPNKDFWKGKILFFETSEQKPSVECVKRMLRNYGVQGVFDRVSAVIFGRARDYLLQEKQSLNQAVIDIVFREFDQVNLPVVMNMDFGHTDPQCILPLGVMAELDMDRKKFSLVESWLS